MQTNKIGHFIAELRNEKRMTQKELAEIIGVSDKTISKWECGKSIPDIICLETLCASFDITMNELLSGERLSEADYSGKAEENIMNLMKEKETGKKNSILSKILGIVLIVATVILIFTLCGVDGYCFGLTYLIDIPSLIFILLLNGATVMLVKNKSLDSILDILSKVLIPNGALITIISVIAICSRLDAIEAIGPNLAVAILAMFWSLVAYIVVNIIKANRK